jgi:hypothetical protein
VCHIPPAVSYNNPRISDCTRCVALPASGQGNGMLCCSGCCVNAAQLRCYMIALNEPLLPSTVHCVYVSLCVAVRTNHITFNGCRPCMHVPAQILAADINVCPALCAVPCIKCWCQCRAFFCSVDVLLSPCVSVLLLGWIGISSHCLCGGVVPHLSKAYVACNPPMPHGVYLPYSVWV